MGYCCMKKILILLAGYFVISTGLGQTVDPSISVIPEPATLIKNAGSFKLPKNIIIEIPSSPELRELSSSLKNKLSMATGYTVGINSRTAVATILLLLNKTPDQLLGK